MDYTNWIHRMMWFAALSATLIIGAVFESISLGLITFFLILRQMLIYEKCFEIDPNETINDVAKDWVKNLSNHRYFFSLGGILERADVEDQQ